MKKNRKFKWWYLIIAIPIFLFIVFYLWIEYQQNSREVIDIDHISDIQVLVDKNKSLFEAIVEGNVELEKFERVSTISAEHKDGVIYIYLTKTKGIADKTNFSQPLGDVLLSHGGNDVEKIAIISGNDIIVHNKKDSTRSYIEFSNYDKIKVIWKK